MKTIEKKNDVYLINEPSVQVAANNLGIIKGYLKCRFNESSYVNIKKNHFVWLQSIIKPLLKKNCNYVKNFNKAK